MMLIGWLPSLAYHFEINGVFYNVTSTTEVEVTYKGSSYDEFYNEYDGSVVIPSLVEYGGFTYSVTSIGDYAFSVCSSLTSIEIPNSVTSIGSSAFYNCYRLTDVVIGNSVTSIGSSAFYNCYRLTDVVIGNSVTSIGDGAFEGCKSLTSIEIPNSVTSIGSSAFAYCTNLTGIEIPNSVTSIGNKAFYRCLGLTRIICTATTPPTIKPDTFSEYSAFLLVPIGCKATYEVAHYWENFNNIIEVTLDKPIKLNDNDAIVATIGDNIVVKNAPLGSNVRVYAADGAMIVSEVATEGDVVIEAPIKGIYVVVVDGKSFKVMVK